LINRETELHVRLDRIRALILQCVSANLVDDPDTAAFLVLVDYDSKTFLLNHFQRQLELRTAVALQRVKHIARQTL